MHESPSFCLTNYPARHFVYVCVVPLQEALTKAAGKKSKTPVQLDLGDMLAALERQQQAMKARQLTNTKPLSYTGTPTSIGSVSTLSGS